MLVMHVTNVILRNDLSAAVLLFEDSRQIRLRFATTYAGGEAILAALRQTPDIRPPTQVLFLDALKQFDIKVSRATIDELRNGLLYAHLELRSHDGKSTTIEALPSDVVAVSLRADVPLEISEQVVTEMGCRRGQLIDVGGYCLSAHVQGSGGPVVVLEAPFGCGHEAWVKIQDSVAQFTTMCSYDRAGLGWSECAPAPRTFQDSVRDLHVLLGQLMLPAPYVLVGHSVGGPLALLYASTYAAEVAGLILVDSAHPDQRTRFLAVLPPERADELPSVRAYRKDLLNPAFLSPEWDDVDICFKQVRDRWSLRDLPLAVITAGKSINAWGLPEEIMAQSEQVWQDLQQDLAQRSSRSTQRFAEQSGHMVPLDQPEIVIDAIREMATALQ